ncbi:MAG: hypothetical protein K2O56_09665 [Muribaculaceae bacterium]|nr:hypothetical protein [Muribaculaceae bacterium]
MKDSSGCIPADRNSGNLNPNINPDMENIIFVSYDMVPDAREPDGDYCEPDVWEVGDDGVWLRDVAAEDGCPYLSGNPENAGKGNAGKGNGVNYPFGKELKRRNTRRAKFKDYRSPGFYMITVNAQKKTPLFCRIYASNHSEATNQRSLPFIQKEAVGERVASFLQKEAAGERGASFVPAGGAAGTGALMPVIEYSDLGCIIRDKIETMPDYTPQLEIVRYVVMPDHLHILIRIKSTLERHLGRVVGGFMGGCTTVARKAGLIAREDSLFTEKFHDRIVCRAGQIARLVNYINDNPRRLLIKRMHPELFRRYLHIRIGEREYAAYGNIFLLKHFDLLPVRIHRRWSPGEFDEYERGCMAQIENGAVPVSPFIHRREKVIRDKTVDCGGSLIIIRDTGFEERFKPQGREFEMCASGRLLLLVPWNDNTGRRSTAGSREFHSMNDMALEISKLPANIRMAIVMRENL